MATASDEQLFGEYEEERGKPYCVNSGAEQATCEQYGQEERLSAAVQGHDQEVSNSSLEVAKNLEEESVESDGGSGSGGSSSSVDENRPRRTIRQMTEGLAFLLGNLRGEGGCATTPLDGNCGGEKDSGPSLAKRPREATRTTVIREKVGEEGECCALIDLNFDKVDYGTMLFSSSSPSSSEQPPPPLLCSVRLDCNSNSNSADHGRPSLPCSNNFLKGCKWSPDGRLLMTSSEDKQIRLFSLLDEAAEPRLSAANCWAGGDSIYDFCWFPLVHRAAERSHMFAVSARDQPIHLLAAASPCRRLATFRAINHLVPFILANFASNGSRTQRTVVFEDELQPAHSLAFSADGGRLYAGCNKAIRVFDCSRSGKQIQNVNSGVSTEGPSQTGIISCIAMHPTFPGSFAAGSYNYSIGFYSSRSGGVESLVRGHRGGVTHLQFSRDGLRLFSGARMDGDINCWDMRQPGKVLATYRRQVATNQRIYFHSDRHDQLLASGSSDGNIVVWHIGANSDPTLKESSWPGHNCAANGVSLHPRIPLLASCSGQRVFPMPYTDSSSSDDEDSYKRIAFGDLQLDNSVKLWNFK